MRNTYKRNISLKIVYLIISCFFLSAGILKAQPEDGVRIGEIDVKKTGVNYYNYADPDKVNIEVIIMGGIKNPGKYLVPKGTTLIDFLSLAGNPVDEELYRNIKLIRPENKEGELNVSNVKIFNYEDLFDKEKSGSYSNINPQMQPGDIVVMQIKPDKTFWDYTKDVLVILTPLIALANLIATIQNNK
ncbi:MAG: SLBB domain-containing protein [Ignavibacteriaceae bacterium]|nr:MAG: hypothetical protein EDM69_05610 [Chlorobiota bacterium]KXK06035.1 MAG: SLBB domain protein [Chlorobi bacterium OLB4]MBV6398470.1 hypothetical protein [Ignavibacteria bacterium]MCC6885704.1 SLBB domain-containing protein [Ignavibacteriales bacterium]MCE7953101.1 hypothetical protein [Chlorobi bacterium CHB7]MDL1887061.1 hypothetical protein [Ignavibacteria bacterium CHB1]MEB2329116.1 SLBB domain-containing protein [Ignavibacteriaceae bacterium]OQY77954.1 MAG: hypothetical protein B6D